MESKSTYSQDYPSSVGHRCGEILRKSSLSSVSSESVTLSETEQALADFAAQFSPQQKLSFIDYSQKSFEPHYGHRKSVTQTSVSKIKVPKTADASNSQQSVANSIASLRSTSRPVPQSDVSSFEQHSPRSKKEASPSTSKTCDNAQEIHYSATSAPKATPQASDYQKGHTAAFRTTQISYAHKRRLCLLKIMRSYASHHYHASFDTQNHEEAVNKKSLVHYWEEALPYCVSHFLDLPSILRLRRTCTRLYYRRRYAVSHISFNFWSTLTQEEIIKHVLPQLRSFLTAGSFAQLNFSQCCLLTDSFPKALLSYDQGRLTRFIKALIFDFCYALSDKSLEALCSTPMPCLEVFSLRCARSRDLTGAPFTTHLSKSAWPRFHQLSCSCTQITLPNLDAAARFLAERAIELNVSPKLGISGSLASYSLIRRLGLAKEYHDFINTLLHSSSTASITDTVQEFEQQWILKIDEPEHRTKVLNRLVRNRAIQILVNAPCSVAIANDEHGLEKSKLMLEEDHQSTSSMFQLYARKDAASIANQDPAPCGCYCGSSSKTVGSTALPSDFRRVDSSAAQSAPVTPKNGFVCCAEEDIPRMFSNVTKSEKVATSIQTDNEKSTNHTSTKTSTFDSIYARWMYPLPMAIRLGKLEYVKYLVSKGAYVDVWGYNFATPLYIACAGCQGNESQTTKWPPAMESHYKKRLDFVNSSQKVASEKKKLSTLKVHVDEPSEIQSQNKLSPDEESPCCLESLGGVLDESLSAGLEQRSVCASELFHSPTGSSASQQMTTKSTSLKNRNKLQEDYENVCRAHEDTIDTSTSLMRTHWEHIFSSFNEGEFIGPADSDRIISPESVCLGEICSNKEQKMAYLNFRGDRDESPYMIKSRQVTQSETSTPTKSGPSLKLPNADHIRRQFTFGIGCVFYDDDRSVCGTSQIEQPLSSLHTQPKCPCSCHQQENLWTNNASEAIVQFLLDNGAPVDPPDLYSTKCPVNAAIKNNNTALLKLLIPKKARLNVRTLPSDAISAVIQHSRRHQQKKQTSRFGYRSPLFIACELEGWNCAEILLQNGADPHWKDFVSNKSLTPALLAYRKNSNTLGLFLQHGTGYNEEHRWVLSEILTAAILHEDLHTIEFLVTEYPDLLEFSTKCMWSLPLIQAARLGKVEIVKRLISLGANVNAVNSEGLTSLHFAANEGRKAVVECMLQHGALPNIKGGIHGKTSLHVAVEENFMSIVPLLLDFGADVTIKDNAGHTPLMTALAARNDKVAMLLVERASPLDLAVLDKAGRSALMYAIYFGQFKVANSLVDKGVTCKVLDATGVSAESLLKAKIDSFGKTTSTFNKFLRNIVGGASQQMASRKDAESVAAQGLVEKSQAAAQSSITVREMNAKRKKIAKALLKKIRAAVNKKPPKSAVDSKSAQTNIQKDVKAFVESSKTMPLESEPTSTISNKKQIYDIFSTLYTSTLTDWGCFPPLEEDDYDVMSDISSASSKSSSNSDVQN